MKKLILLMVLVAAPARAQSYVANTTGAALTDSLAAYGALGAVTSTAAATLQQACKMAPLSGHFLTLRLLHHGPKLQRARHLTLSTSGTAKACGNSAGSVNQTENAAKFTAGDIICITRTANGATCVAPLFSVVATMAYP